jgi:spore germination cell wall hydrolase CwlJ-like protein
MNKLKIAAVSLVLGLGTPVLADSADEIKCLADNIYFEARSEDIDGQVAVAWVTLNRRDANGFRDTVCKVVWQTEQFSWTHDGKSDIPAEPIAYQIAYTIAKDLYENYEYFDDPTYGATYYHANYANPYWVPSFDRVATIGKHIFYRG